MTQPPKTEPNVIAWRAALLAPGAVMQKRAAAFSVLAGLLWPLQAAVVAWAIGGLLAGAAPSPWLAAFAFAGLGLCRAALGYVSEAQAQGAAEAVIAKARAQMVATEAGRAGESGFGGAGSLAALAGEKLELLAPFLTRYGPARARVMVLPLVILTLALSQSWAVAIIFLISGPLIPVFMALVGMAAKETSARQMAEIGSLNDLLVERLSALVDIRVLGAGPAVAQGFSRQARQLRHRTMAVLGVAFLSSTVLELFSAIGVAMVAVYVGFSLLGTLQFGAWGGAITPEMGIFLLLLAPEFYQPLRDLSAAWHDKAAADAVIDEAYAVARVPGAALLGRGGASPRLAGPADIAVQGCLTPAGNPLPDIVIAAGEKVALVGPSGVGKTSALRLMAGLEVPRGGTVRVGGGQALTAANADAWRARVGWMPQAPHFLNESLRHNLTLGRDDCGGTDLGKALETAAVTAVVAALPQGLATRLGETGGGLSGGEARRITLARAVFGAPDVILADEPTADLDVETARIVTEGLLRPSASGTTLVIATHDPKLAAQMDRIIVFEGQS